jgi:hypothetical protein
MAKPLTDHIPRNVQIGTSIPKAQVFMFEFFFVSSARIYGSGSSHLGSTSTCNK